MREIMDVSYGKDFGKNSISFKTKNKYFLTDHALEYDDDFEKKLSEIIFGRPGMIQEESNVFSILISDTDLMQTDYIVKKVRELVSEKKKMNDIMNKFESNHNIMEEYEI